MTAATRESSRLTMNAIIEDVAWWRARRNSGPRTWTSPTRRRGKPRVARVPPTNARQARHVFAEDKLKTQMAEFQDLRAAVFGVQRGGGAAHLAVAGEKPDAETLDHLVETGESETIFQKVMKRARADPRHRRRDSGEARRRARVERNFELHQIFPTCPCWWRRRARCWTTSRRR